MLRYISFQVNKNCVSINKRLFASNIKSYEEIPSPFKWPLIGHSYLFLPGVGKYIPDRLTEAIQDLSLKLGPVFKLNLNNNDIVITTNADDISIITRNEGKFPNRPRFEALHTYRQKVFGSAGLVPGNDEEWYKYRKAINPLLNSALVKTYAQKHEDVASTFVNVIEQQRNSERVVKNIYKLLLKFAIEAISVTCPGERYHCLTNDIRAEKVIRASVDFMDGLYKTLIGPSLWKIYRTEGYRKLESSHSTIYNEMKHSLTENKLLYDKNPENMKHAQPFLYSLFENKTLSWNDIVILALEIFLGGIDATATTIALTLHYFSHNAEIQEKARREALSDDSLDLPYLRACVKETLRISPTAGAHGRYLPQDVVIGGYLVPSGTLISAFLSVTSKDEKYFNDPLTYNPERWMRGQKSNLNPFVSLPFGHGPRMCPGRQLAMQEIIINLRQVLKRFELKPRGDENIGMVYRMNRIADRSIDIEFVNINF